MRFTVVWLEDARDELAEIWLAADDRAAVSRAAHVIDRDLSSDPEQKGVLLSEGLWRFDTPPLRVYFSIRQLDGLVEVAQILQHPAQ